MLHIDTATSVCSVALSLDGIAFITMIQEESNRHIELIHLYIDRIMNIANWSFDDLDAISITLGPGSYTGLRVGMSTAKGLCFGKDIPLIGLDTLECLAQPYLEAGYDYIIPTIDARRDEVYYSILDSQGVIMNESDSLVLEKNKYPTFWPSPSKTLICGNGSEKARDLLKNEDLEIKFNISKAENQSKLALKKLVNQDFSDLFFSKPNYLKPPNITTPKNKLRPI